MNEQLPDPPWRVLATAPHISQPRWWLWSQEEMVWFSDDPLRFGYAAINDDLAIIDHPHNDPEAVEIIRKAKEGT